MKTKSPFQTSKIAFLKSSNGLLVLLLSVAVISCSKKSDTDKVAEAQACLDRATQATWSECYSMVDGLENKGSYNIRCVAKFLQQGFGTSTKLQSMMNAITNSTGSSESAGVMSAIAFTADSSPAVNKDTALATLQLCQSSGSKGLIFLSSIASIATTAAWVQSTISAIDTSDPAAMLTAIQNISTDPAAQAAVGTAAIAAYTSNCTGANASANSDMCSQFASAVTSAGGTSNPTAVGSALAYCYTHTTAPQCTGF